MKQLNKISVVLLGIAVLFILYLLECKRTPDAIPKGYVMMSQDAIDSINALSGISTVVIQVDTLIVKEPVYIKAEIPVPTEIVVGVTHYQDSIINDSIRFWEDIWVKGSVTAWQKKYEPIIHYKETLVEITVPQIVFNEVPVYKRELYLSGVIGGHATMFSYGLDLDFVNKKRNIYGLQYRRAMDNNFLYFKIGTKILPRK